MADFPNIPPTSYSETIEDNAIKDDFENGYVQSRAKYTRARKVYQYNFSNIDSSDADLIMDFFYSVGTYLSFNLTLPQNKGTVVVRFTKPPSKVYVSPTISSIKDVEFREV